MKALINKWFAPSMIYLFVVTFALCTSIMETDVYVPSFPNMLAYFNTTEYMMELLVSLNFVGLCISALVYGTLSDSFGRRRVVLVGLFIFMVASIGCVFTNSMELMLVLRLIQGFGAGATFSVLVASFFDVYDELKAAKIITYINLIISMAVAGAPILGSWVNLHYGWRANFTVIAVLSILTVLFIFKFFKETLPVEKRVKFEPKKPVMDYLKLLSSYRFIANAMIFSLMLTGMVLYVANLSLIFVNHLNVPQDIFAYYQASVLVGFMITSYIMIKIVDRVGLDCLRKVGTVVFMLGSTLLMLTAIFLPTSPLVITVSMIITTIGTTLGIIGYYTQAVSLFPAMKGAANALAGSCRLAMIAILISVSGQMFDGTIFPVALIIFLSAVVCAGLIVGLKIVERKSVVSAA